MTGEELRGGWVAIQDGFVKVVGGGVKQAPDLGYLAAPAG